MKIIDLQEEQHLREEIRRYFPHPQVRKYQADLANRLYDSLTGVKHVVVEAPTGLGKTSTVWAAVKAYAEERGLRILWLTRTASQVRQVAAETGIAPVYGRKLLCLHEVISKIDRRRFNQACKATRQAGRCPYYPGRPHATRAVTVTEIKEAGMRTGTCPYELQLLNLSASTALVATHRQLGLIGWLLAKWRWTRERTLLVIDEAQHIIQNALMMTRDSISLKTLARAASEAERYGFGDLADSLREAVRYYGRLLNSDGEVEAEDRLPDYEELYIAGEEVQEKKLRENYAPASFLLLIADFKAASLTSGGKLLLVREGTSIRLEATTDPQEVIKQTYSGWSRTITLSATISAELIEALLGEEVTLLRAGWPFEDNLRAWVVKGLTTRFERRDEKMTEDIRWVLRLAGRKTRTLVFLPSFEILEDVVKGIDILHEDRGLPQESVDRLISEFSSSGRPLAAVFQGRLSEGVDLSADLVLLVGVPFSPPSVRSIKLLTKLSEILGDRKAKLYGVVLPALWTALQAAGRAVRGPEDEAVVLMIDDRYRSLLPLLPR